MTPDLLPTADEVRARYVLLGPALPRGVEEDPGDKPPVAALAVSA